MVEPSGDSGAQWFIAYDPASGDEIWRVTRQRVLERSAASVRRAVSVPQYGFRQTAVVGGPPGRLRRRVRDPRGLARNAADSRDELAGGEWRADLRYQRRRRRDLLRHGDRRDAVAGRLPGKYSASPLACAGRVYFSSHEGKTTVVADAADFERSRRMNWTGC